MSDRRDHMEFEKKIQFLRKENRMSQEKLAERINVSRQAISKWEQGTAVPDTDNIVQLSKFFQVPIEYLLFDEYDSVEEVEPTEPASNQETMLGIGIKKERSSLMIIVGTILEILAVCFSYIIQYYDMDQNGSFYTEALEYLRHFPLSLIVIIGIVCIAVGGYKITKSKIKNRPRKEKEL